MTDEEAKALAAKFFEDKPTPPALHTDRQREVEKLPASSQADAKCEHGSMFEGCPICYERVTGQQDAEVDAVRELCTADMPSDEIRATNGYTYVLKSAYDRVVAERDQFKEQYQTKADLYRKTFAELNNLKVLVAQKGMRPAIDLLQENSSVRSELYAERARSAQLEARVRELEAKCKSLEGIIVRHKRKPK